MLAVGAREADTVGRVLRLIRSYDEDEPIQFRIIRRGSELTAEGFLQCLPRQELSACSVGPMSELVITSNDVLR